MEDRQICEKNFVQPLTTETSATSLSDAHGEDEEVLSTSMKSINVNEEEHELHNWSRVDELNQQMHEIHK